MVKKKDLSKPTPDPTPADQETLDFEQTLSEVESIVGQLESGSLGLSESLQQYETGIRQLKRCHQLLDAAEQRVSLLAGFDADGNPVHEPVSQKTSSTGSSRKASVKGRSTKEKSSKQPLEPDADPDPSSTGDQDTNDGEQLF